MNIELSQKEIELLDDALVAWQKQPHNEGFSKALMGTIVRGMAKREGESLEDEDDPKAILATVEIEAKARERRSLLLRAKLAQAAAIASEHEV